MNFLHFYRVFFLDGGGRGKILWRHWWFMLENKVFLLSQPLHPNAGLTKADALGEFLILCCGRNPGKCWVSRLQMRSEQVGDPQGTQSSWAAVCIPPSSSLSTGDLPPARGRRMWFVVSQWNNLFSKEKKELRSKQEEWIKKFIRGESNKAINLGLSN